MKKIKIILLTVVVTCLGMGNLAFADTSPSLGTSPTLIPVVKLDETGKPVADCNGIINDFNKSSKLPGNPNDLIGCAIWSGRISLTMVPYIIKYISNWLLGLASLIAMLFVVIGGFMYTAGGIAQKKDAGKNYITNALIGMAIAFLSWIIVNVILSALTG